MSEIKHEIKHEKAFELYCEGCDYKRIACNVVDSNNKHPSPVTVRGWSFKENWAKHKNELEKTAKALELVPTKDPTQLPSLDSHNLTFFCPTCGRSGQKLEFIAARCSECNHLDSARQFLIRGNRCPACNSEKYKFL